MTGRGKEGKCLAKCGAKRHRKVSLGNIQVITKPAIRRLACRGGVKRISDLIYVETRCVLKVFSKNVIRDAVMYTEHAKGKKGSPETVIIPRGTYYLRTINVNLVMGEMYALVVMVDYTPELQTCPEWRFCDLQICHGCVQGHLLL